MKRFGLLLISLFAFTALWAQEKEEVDYLPKKGDAGIVFNVAGLISNINVAPVKDPMGNDLILGKYYLQDNQVFRLGLGVKSFNNEYNLVDSIGSQKRTYDSTYKKFNFYISPGYEFHMKNFKRLDPYIGAGINLGLLGKNKIQIDEDFEDTTGTDQSQTTFEKDGGFMFGINGVVGFNYFLAPRLAMGLEYNIGYYWSIDGGDYERVTVVNPVSGQSRSSREIGSERQRDSGFDHSNNLSINVSYYFGTAKKNKGG